MVSRSKLSLLVTAAVFAFLLAGTAHAASAPIDSSSTPAGSVLATAWNWVVSVFAPSGGNPGTTTSSGEPKAGCEMDPNGVHLVPGDPSSSGVNVSVH